MTVCLDGEWSLSVALPRDGAVPALGVVEQEVQGVGPRSRPVVDRHFHEHPEHIDTDR